MKLSSSIRKSIDYAILAFIAGVFFLLCLMAMEFYLKRTNRPDRISEKVEKVLREKEKLANETLNKSIYIFITGPKQPGNNFFTALLPVIRKDGMAIQFYINDSLAFWSDNSVAELKGIQIEKPESVQKLPNGWYDVIVLAKGNIKAVCLMLIKHEYSFENEFLENSFQEDFKVPEGVEISAGLNGNVIRSLDEIPLFSFDFSGFVSSYNGQAGFLFILLLLPFFSFCMALYFANSAIEWFNGKPFLFVVFFTADVILLRLIQAWFTFPLTLYSTVLFSPLYYSSSVFLPSAGDYLFNGMIMLLIAFIAYKKLVRPDKHKVKLTSVKSLKGWVAVAFILLIYISLCFGLDDLLRNSSFSLDLKDISKVGAKSVIGLLIVYCLAMAFYLFSGTAGFFIQKFSKFNKGLIIAVGTTFVFLLEQTWMDRYTAMILAALFTAYLSLLFFYFDGKARGNPFANFILPMVWMAVLVTVVFNNAGYLREKEERKLIAIQLANEKNPVTELLYNKLEHKLLSDSVIIAMTRDFNAGKEESLIRRINSGYIRDFWNRFTVQITVCPPGKMLKIQPRGYVYNCEQYFQQVCDKVGEKTSNPNLFYLDYGTGIETYLGILKPHDSVKNVNAGEIKIFIEFTAKTPSKDMGYPELLIDRRIMNIPDLGNYSYGLYQNAYLVYKTGKYSYPTNLSNLIRLSDSSSFFNFDGMNHYRYTLDKSRELLVSKKNDSFLGLISPASYLFIMFSLLTLFLNFVYRPSAMKEFSFITLKNRFQIANVGMIVVSFLILGCLLLYFLIRLNNLKNMDSFSERTLSVMLEMQEKFGEKDKLDKPDNPALEEDLQRLSGMFYTDVNVYSVYGKLILSSRPQVFDEGLISGRMNIGAYTDLKKNKQSAFFQDEKIGAYDYISAYFPLLNDRNELLAYINLPFFSRQEDLRKEINDFLIAFMNLYILFILISIFISFAISRYLSAPLGILVSRMEGFQLGKRNEKINWYHQDEIGRLVEEYNRLIDELAFSADQLAKSERETAWREMARQVAHEIKNPLTPMKLSVQHLRKTWDEQSGDFNQRIQRFTKIMTEQIDSLSSIATEFSDFAKMPLPVSEELDLIEILSSVVSMYLGLENIEIRLETSENQAKIKGDRRQIVRVFTNLLNNAAQAISKKEKGLIKISVCKKGKNYSVDIEDNGNGIPDELSERIFLPNFTTKSGGAGLGLAIVKGIIINMGGDITFASLTNGTVFTINIPVFNDKISA